MSTSEPAGPAWPPRRRGRTAVWGALLLVGLVAWIAMLAAGDAARAWRALLVAYVFFTTLAAGMVVWSAILPLSRGGWAGPLARLSFGGLGFAIPSIVLLVPLWISSATWAPWRQQPVTQGAWLTPGFLFGRDLLGLLLFWSLAAWHARRTTGRAAPVLSSWLVVVYAAVFSLIGFDLVMALDPGWASDAFGAWFFVSGAYLGLLGWTGLAVLHPDGVPKRYHDFGKLLVAFGILTGYLAYAHLLPIWYENMPRETRFLVPRMNRPEGRILSAIVVGLGYLGPLVLLLPVAAKRSRRALGIVVGLLLLTMWLETFWWIAPAFGGRFAFGAPEIATTLALGGLFAFSVEWALRHRDVLAPAGASA